MRRLSWPGPARTAAFCAMAVLWGVASSAFADVIYDRSGGTLKGLVVEEHRDRIVFGTENGEKTVLRSEIDDVFYSEPERNYLYLGNQALEEKDFSIARGFFRKALQINPQLSEAQDALERTDDWEKKPGFGPASDPLPALEKQWGMRLGEGKRLVQVLEIRPGSFAGKAGLAAGDDLATAWSGSLAFLSVRQIAEELVGPPGSKLKLTLQRRIQISSAGKGPWPGMKLSMKRLGLMVMETEAAGLAPQDRILSIDGQATRYLPLGKARRLIEDARKKGVVFVIERDILLTRE